ncbi:transposase [Cellulosilyticum sp. I15G10I2]|uniref:transposase n=1 Tax=Cellulosilyticum sp. I15G10I2 TaxID=1892843 RepID=UPI002E8E270F|nr:transposase [Cellulosilyticum sp. I15G10I2]
MKFDGLHWYVSVDIEAKQEEVNQAGESIGIDIGIKDLAICSNSDKPYKSINKSKRIRRLEKKLCRLEHKVSNKYEKNKEGRSYVKTSNIKNWKKELESCTNVLIISEPITGIK